LLAVADSAGLAEDIDFCEIDNFISASAKDCSEREQAEAFRLVNTDRRWHGEFLPAHEEFDQGRPVMLESLRNHRFNLFRCLAVSPRRPAAPTIRQSTPDQVQYNLESKRRQCGLADRARALGWVDIDVIDDDLGISGDRTRRPGFERLLRALCDGQVGAVFCIEASRLARNGREWHTLLDFCSVVDALLIDAETIYDPKVMNDRLLLGMKRLDS
jgi:hypothetical protein